MQEYHAKTYKYNNKRPLIKTPAELATTDFNKQSF